MPFATHSPLLAAIPWLAPWMLHGGLFLAGAALVAAPIIIHLLNKRKFKIIDWAAMDFLLEADKRNRRRIRLENLLLLLLRCLAVLLLALLVGRPFIPTGWSAGLLDSAQFERIVVLDDSLSMQARSGNRTAFDVAKKSLGDFVRSLAHDASDNTLTLLVTSQPEKRLFHGRAVTADSLDEILASVETLEPSDTLAQLPTALRGVEELLGSEAANVNRVVYVITDLRAADWAAGDTEAKADTTAGALRRLRDRAEGCVLVDAGSDEIANLVVAEVRPQTPPLLAGVASQKFDVVVVNHGAGELHDVAVKLNIGQSVPLSQTVETLAPHKPETLTFEASFAKSEAEGEARHTAEPVKVTAEVASASPATEDRLPADSVRSYAARVLPGVPVLLVDGDPSAAYGRAESFFLRRALAPRGAASSGVAADVVTEAELETVPLAKYRVLVLCNVARPGANTAEPIAKPAADAKDAASATDENERLSAIRKWVQEGGSLVWMLGDQVDEEYYNRQLYRGGSGLLPVKLEGLKGDETAQSWVNFQVAEANHPALRVFTGENNPFLPQVKIFRWWKAAPAAGLVKSGELSIAATLTDDTASPVWLERTLGKGRIVTLAIPGDRDWHNWPDDPSYLVAMQELVFGLSRGSASEGQLRTGEPLMLPVDLGQYRAEGELTTPAGVTTGAQAVPPEGSSAGDANALWRITYPLTQKQGFYAVKLARNEGGSEDVLFAANVAPSEGDLRRVENGEVKRQLGGAAINLVAAESWTSQESTGAEREVWKELLAAVVLVLFAEQFFAWLFGLKR